MMRSWGGALMNAISALAAEWHHTVMSAALEQSCQELSISYRANQLDDLGQSTESLWALISSSVKWR